MKWNIAYAAHALVALTTFVSGLVLYVFLLREAVFYQDFFSFAVLVGVFAFAVLVFFHVPWACALIGPFVLISILWDPAFRVIVFNLNPVVAGIGPIASLSYLRRVMLRRQDRPSAGMNLIILLCLVLFVSDGIHSCAFFRGSFFYPFYMLYTHTFVSDISTYLGMMWFFDMIALPSALFSAWFILNRFENLDGIWKRWAVHLALATMGAYFLYALYRFYVQLDFSVTFWGFNRLTTLQSDPNSLGFRLGILALLFFALAAAKKDLTRPRVLVATLLGACMAFLIGLTLSRSTILAFCGGLGGLLYKGGFSKKTRLAIGVASVCAAIGVSSIVFGHNYFIRLVEYTPGQLAEHHHPEYSRPMGYEWAIVSLPRYVWKGIGPGWRKEYVEYAQEKHGKDASEERIIHLHNLFLDYAVLGGIFLVLPFIGLLAWLFVKGRGREDYFENRLALSLGIFVFIHSLLNVAFHYPLNRLLFFAAVIVIGRPWTPSATADDQRSL